MTIQYLTLKELCDMDFSSKFYNDYAEKKDMQEEYVTIKDVFLILEDGKIIDVLCEDKGFGDYLLQMLQIRSEIDSGSFTSTHRCCIISISEIESKLSYEEFYSRYGGYRNGFAKRS